VLAIKFITLLSSQLLMGIMLVGNEMRKRFAAVLLCVIVAASTVAAYGVTSWNNTKSLPKAQVGIFYYVWYANGSEVSWNRSKIVDQPVLGYYNSSDSAIIRQHVLWMKGLGINFVVVSWWGFYDDYGKFTDNAAKQVFEVAAALSARYGVSMKFAIMVEPFNKSGSSYDYAGIYDHIYDDFVVPYSSIYYNHDSKPLICFFNDENLTDDGAIPSDGRFDTVLVGQSPYVQWVYTDLNCYAKPTESPYTNQTIVTPRFDDSRFRKPSCVVDPNLTEGVYDQEWKNAIQLVKDGKVNIVMITSWNEYVERTEIEPHYDATAYNHDPYFLYSKTKDYINQLPLPNSGTSTAAYIAVGAAVIIIAVVAVAAIAHRRRKPLKKWN
jgi:hypothetical protein